MGEDKDFEGTSVATLVQNKGTDIVTYATWVTNEEI